MGLLEVMADHLRLMLIGLVTVTAGCRTSVEEVAPPDGGSPPSRCRAYMTKDACCDAECYWLGPNGTFLGACFDEYEDCALNMECSADDECYTMYSSGKGECDHFHPAGRPMGVCVDSCPESSFRETINGREICVKPPQGWDGGSGGGSEGP
jgi:hypothetical protein